MPRDGEPVIAGRPDRELAMPDGLRAIVSDSSARTVWLNEAGGMTWELTSDCGRRFAKWAPTGSGLDLAAEAARLSWAASFTTVPRVLDTGGDAGGSWLITDAVPGRSAVDERWTADPATAVRAIGAGLRHLHDVLPVSDCPFSWSAQSRLAGLAVQPARRPPPIDRLVVCHGDACAPNTLIGDDGRWSGHVDLGSLGTADRWADLAVATWSTEWNYGPGWTEPLLTAYGVQPDPERIAYYRLLWDLG